MYKNNISLLPDQFNDCFFSISFINTLKIFKWLKKEGISEKEMLKTFNCGVGFCIIVNPKNLKKIKKYFSRDFKPYVIGKISNNSQRVKFSGKINWK